MMSHSRRALFVSYLFPPVGGVGVQRVTKFVKFLPEFGWQSSVLTVSNPSVPLYDESYQRDIPANTIIRRAKTFEPGYALKQAVSADNGGSRPSVFKRWLKSVARTVGNTVLQPDAQVLWHRHAFREGLKLLQEVSHDVIVATGPPFSSLLLGARLARSTGLPLVLDYRDEWDISNAYWENKQQGPLANWIQQRQQARAMRAADVLLATTPSSAPPRWRAAPLCLRSSTTASILRTSPQVRHPLAESTMETAWVDFVWRLSELSGISIPSNRSCRRLSN